MTEPRWASLPTDPAELTPLPDAFHETLASALEALDLSLSPGIQSALEAHARLLVAWNEAMNLTALRRPEQLALEHVVDSLSALPLLRRLAADRPVSLLDLGSGGGFPGLPLAVALPVKRATLVDSIAKKAGFLGVAADAARAALAAAGEAEPSIEAVCARAETLGADPRRRGSWTVVVARAVARMPRLVELALPLVARGGWLIAWKRGPELESEVEEALPALARLGGDAAGVEIVPVTVPGLEDHRLVLVPRVTGAAPTRPPGRARPRRLLLR